MSQPKSFAVAALERLLSLLGITDVVCSLSVTTIVDAKDNVLGYIVSGQLDVYDRPVCYAFGDVPSFIDGMEIEGNDIPIEESINF